MNFVGAARASSHETQLKIGIILLLTCLMAISSECDVFLHRREFGGVTGEDLLTQKQ